MIAQEICIHPSTIIRELIRNNAKRGRIANVSFVENVHRKNDPLPAI
jgi:IS30 family transposase